MTKQGHDFKHHAITRIGYEYQDLISLKTLIDLYTDKERYEWIELEAQGGEFKAIDDVVALRKSDEKYELTQVKFTVDPARQDLTLSLDWLTEHKAKGTSNLQKWAKTVLSDKYTGKIHSAQLITNRIPDSELKKYLKKGFVQYDHLPQEYRDKIVSQLGSEVQTKAFFEEFKFNHSNLVLDDLYWRLRDRLVPSDTDEAGWLLLLENIKKWATRKNNPSPDGKIRFKDIAALLSLERPRALNQQFVVPDDYVIPSDEFHQNLIQRINDNIKWTVIWGVPGRGKSTYLSNLVDVLTAEDVPCLRHHYFLSLTDTSDDRVSYSVLANSLMSQMRHQFPEAISTLKTETSYLSEWLSACAQLCASLDKPLVIVVDGLDHVWREGRNIEQMQHFFSSITVADENLVIVVGTQRVADKFLPSQLLTQCPKSQWLELPSLSQSAVNDWVSRRLKTKLIDAQGESVLSSEVSYALYEISNGHPLHLIYSLEYAIRNQIDLTKENILKLPECPDGDIRTYYNRLWFSLSKECKLALHLLAGTSFNWPSLLAVKSVLEKASLNGPLDDIDHLLERRSTEIMPFHGSVLAWVRELEDHKAEYESFSTPLANWLESEAPEYWRWAFLHVHNAENGDPSGLLNEVSRDWALRAFQSGRPNEDIIRVLNTAEKYALEATSFGKLFEFRSIKIRILNAPEYQIHDFHYYQEAVWESLENSFFVERLYERLGSLSSDELLILSKNEHSHAIPSATDRIHKEFVSRQNRIFNNENSRDADFDGIIFPTIKFVARNNLFSAERTVAVVSQFPNCQAYLNAMFWVLLEEGAVEQSIALAKECLRTDIVEPEVLSAMLVRLGAREELDLSVIQNIEPCYENNIYKIWHFLKHGQFLGKPVTSNDSLNIEAELEGYGKSIRFINLLKDSFFAGLASGLQADGNEEIQDRFPLSDAPWIEVTAAYFFNFGKGLAADQINGSASLKFSTIFEISQSIDRPAEGDFDSKQRQYSSFKFALLEIARECHFLGSEVSEGVSRDSIEIARSSVHWLEEVWIEEYLKNGQNYFSKDAIETLVRDALDDLNSEVTQFDERALLLSQLACMALRHNLKDLGRELLDSATICLLGYGYRKDYWLWDVISAVRFCAIYGGHDVLQWITKLAPVIDKVDVFTDGDEIPHARSYFAELLMDFQPSLLPSFYRRLIEEEEWYEADKIFRDYLNKFGFENRIMQGVVSTVQSVEDLTLSKNDLDLSSEDQKILLRKLELQNGEEIDLASQSTSIEESDDEKEQPDYSSFKPHQLTALLSELDEQRIIMGKDQYLIDWVKYWDANNKGEALIEAFTKFISETKNLYPISRCLDELFQIVLKRKGKTLAYSWLVKSQIENNGWSRWQGDKERKERVELAGSKYPSKWLDFIKDTSKANRYGDSESLVFGSDYLVLFLLKCGRVEEAINATEAMVKTIGDELKGQPLREATWFR